MTQNLLATFAYFTAQKRLVTVEEVYRYQFQSSDSIQDLEKKLLENPQIRSSQGLYGLTPYFDDLLALHQEKGRESLRRYRTLKRYGTILISIPYIRAIFIAGSTGFSTGNAKKSSDIDLFVITKQHRIWLARIFITLITQILGIRRSGRVEENRVCLNHYISEDNLHRDDHTLYSAQLYADYIALGQESQSYLERFWKQNQWINQIFPQAQPRRHTFFEDIRPLVIKSWLEWLLEHSSPQLFNNLAKWLQLKKIQSNSVRPNQFNRIQISDRELEFHPEPNSPKIEQEMQVILNEL